MQESISEDKAKCSGTEFLTGFDFLHNGFCDFNKIFGTASIRTFFKKN